MDLLVRPARPEDPCVPLLFESAKPYYTAYAGSEQRALALLEAVFAEPGHAASYELLPRRAGRRASSSASSPASRSASGDRLSRRFVRLTLPELPPWRWPGTFRHLRAAGGVAPAPAARRLLRRRARGRRRAGGAAAIAQRLLDDAARRGRARRAARGSRSTPACRTPRARALYDAYGFGEREIRRAPDDRTARALGGPGFVGYLKAV